VGRFFQGSGPWGYRLYWRPPGGSTDVLIPPTVLSGSGPSRGVTAHTGISLNASSQLTAWARSGVAGGVTAVTNATTNNGTTTGIDIRSSAVLLGDVRVGVGSTVATVLRQYQSGAWTGSGTALSVPAAVERVSMPIVPLISWGNISLSGSTAIPYGPGTIRVSSLTLSADSVLTINGETVLIVDGALSLSNQARIQLATGAKLRMYVGGNVSMAGTAQLNGTSSRSPDLRLFMTSTGTPTFSMLNNAVFCGALQNPNGTVSITNDTTFYGTIEADRVTLDNQARIFADVSATTGGSSIASATLVYFTDLTLPN
jgi:hypothetical protein